MNKISEAELVVMKCIWKNEEITSLKLIEELEKTTKWSKATIKTLLRKACKKECCSCNKKYRKFISL